MKYLLPCSCGKSIAIEISQAGQQVTCSCGTQLEVPAFRLIKQLEPAQDDKASTANEPGKWTALQRVLFSIGLAITVAALVWAALGQFGRSHLQTKEVAWDHTLDSDLQALDKMNLLQSWQSWVSVRDRGIGPHRPPQYILERGTDSRLKKYVLWGMVVAGTGILLMGIALVLPRQRNPLPK